MAPPTGQRTAFDLFLEQNLKEKGGVVHPEDRGKRVKADVVVDGVECEKAESFKCGSVLVYHDDLAVLEVLLVVNHDGIKIKGVSGWRCVIVLLISVKKKKVVVNNLANEIEGGVRAEGLGAGDKLKASDVNAGNDKGF